MVLARHHRVLFADRIPRGSAPAPDVSRATTGNRIPDHEPVPEIADEVPWSNRLTEYDNRHVDTYVRLLEAQNEGLPKDDIARRILGIDPDAEPARARKAVESHMARARWMGEVGYRLLLTEGYPDRERTEAEHAEDERTEALILECLQSLGITVLPRGGTLDEGS